MTGEGEKVYAGALFQIGVENNNVDKLYRELVSCREIFEKNPELFRILSSPVISFDEKTGLLDRIFSQCKTIRDFLCVLVEHKRIEELMGIIDYFFKKYKEYENKEDVTVITSMPLTDIQREKLKKRLSEKSGKDINLKEETDPSIMGGIIVEFNNLRLDNSIRGKLKAIEKSLNQYDLKEGV